MLGLRHRTHLILMLALMATGTCLVATPPGRAAGSAPGAWTLGSDMQTARSGQSATLLDGPECHRSAPPSYCGRILVVGGAGPAGPTQASEIYDPATRSSAPTADLRAARTGHSSVLLSDGRVLVAGGLDAAGTPVPSAEIYEPASVRRLPDGTLAQGVWTPAGQLVTPRAGATATVLTDGRVLVAGGRAGAGNPVPAAEVFDPAVDRATGWRAVAPMGAGRASHTATLLATGDVLVTGGESTAGPLASTERFDPGAGTWRPGPPLAKALRGHTATRLPAGNVLVTGGGLASIFDPTASGGGGAWTSTAPPLEVREAHTATLLLCAVGDTRPHCGSVVVAGGTGPSGFVATTEMYSPSDHVWRRSGDLVEARESHTATALPGGQVIVTGGRNADVPLASTEVFDPLAAGTPPSVTSVSRSGGPVSGGSAVTITGVAMGGATQVLFGDRPATTVVHISPTDVLAISPAQDAPATVDVTVVTPEGSSWPTNRSRFRYAYGPTVTALSPDTGAASGGTPVVVTGTVLDFPDVHVLFGDVPATTILSRSDTKLTVVAPPHAPGQVDVQVFTPAGFSAPTFADRFTYGDGSWEPTGPMKTARYHHTATLLPDGRVLAAGGTDNYMSFGTAFASAELYDPDSGAWTPAGAMQEARFSHTATLLDGPSCRSEIRAAWCGKVLVAGGQKQLPTGTWTAVAGAELYDPATNRWTPAGTLGDARFSHTATLLDGPACATTPAPAYCGKVLVAGGTRQEVGNRPPLRTSELYDPATNSWSPTGALDTACTVDPCGRTNHTATLLPDGRVLAAGGLVADPSATASPGTGFSSDATVNGESFTSVGHSVFSPQKGPDPRAVTLSDPPAGSPVEAGSRITYTIRYFNGGEQAALAAVAMTLSRQVDFVAANGGGTYDETSRKVSFPTVSIAPTTSAVQPAGTFEVVALVRVTTAPGPSDTGPPNVIRDDTAIVASIGGLPGASVSHTFLRAAAYRVAVSSTPVAGSMVAPGDAITYTLAAFNTGRSPGEPVTLTDHLPDELDFVSATGGGTFDATTRTVTFPPVVTPPGTTAETPAAQRQIIGRVRDKRPDGSTVFDTSVITNRATIGGVDSNPVSHKVLRTPPTNASVQLSLSANPPPGSALSKGSRITYTMSYFNAGAATASGVAVSLKLPSRTTFVSSSAGGTFDGTTKVSFPAVDVPPGSTAAAPAGSVTVTVEVLGLPGTIITAAAVTSSGGQSNAVEHSVLGPTVRLVATSDPPPTSAVRHGDRITYTLSYFNLGGATAGAVVKLQLAPDVQFVSATGGGRLDAAGGTVIFPEISVAAGTSATQPAGRLSVTVQLGLVTRPSQTAEVYDPSTGTWHSTAGPMAVARFGHTATLLAVRPCGERCDKVLVVGGVERLGAREPFYTQTAELFDPKTETWSPAGVPDTARANHSASVLSDGTVLVAGGAFGFPIASAPRPNATAEVYDPVSGTWRNTAAMRNARGLHTATVLAGSRCGAPESHAACGDVLGVGGGTDSSAGSGSEPPALASAELYAPPKLPPTVSGLEARSGPSKGGTTITLAGSGFDTAATVTFGEAPAPGVVVSSPSRLTVVTPPHASGVVDVTVSGVGGTSTPTLQSRFTYTISSAPTRVTDLSATSTQPSEVELSFSAPTSDGPFPPPATRFVVKQAPAPVDDEAAFRSAATLCGGECVFAPSAVGQTLTLTIGDLAAGSTYHYALRAVNDFGVGPISNLTSATTAPAPVAPPSDPINVAIEPTRQTPVSDTDVRATAPRAGGTTPSAPGPASAAPAQRTTATSAASTTTVVGQGPTVRGPAASTPTTVSREAGQSPASRPGANGTRWWLVTAIWAPVMLGLAALGSFLSRRTPGRHPERHSGSSKR